MHETTDHFTNTKKNQTLKNSLNTHKNNQK